MLRSASRIGTLVPTPHEETKSADAMGAGRPETVQPGLLAAQPVIDFAFGLIFGVAVMFLEAAFKLFSAAINDA